MIDDARFFGGLLHLILAEVACTPGVVLVEESTVELQVAEAQLSALHDMIYEEPITVRRYLVQDQPELQGRRNKSDRKRNRGDRWR